MTENDQTKKPRGIAALSDEKRRAFAAKGGRAAQARGKAHRFMAGSEEARAAGRKGGKAKRNSTSTTTGGAS